MNQILSHQHISLPLWTNSRLPDDHRTAPDMLVHVQVTVIRTRYRSVFRHIDDDRDPLFAPRYLSPLPEAQKPADPVQKAAGASGQARTQPAAPSRKPVMRDPLANDATFREKYMLN